MLDIFYLHLLLMIFLVRIERFPLIIILFSHVGMEPTQSILQSSKLHQKYKHIDSTIFSEGYSQQLWKKHSNDNQYVVRVFKLKKLEIKETNKIDAQVRKYRELSLKSVATVEDYDYHKDKMWVLGRNYKKKLIKDWLKHPQKYGTSVLKSMFIELARTVNELHQAGMTHNRINIQEIYLKHGKAVICTPNFRSVLRLQNKSKIKCWISKESQAWLAPQIAEGYQRSKTSDIWDLGIVFLQLSTGKILEKRSNELEDAMIQLLNNKITEVKDNFLRTLIAGMLHPEPGVRVTAEKVINYLDSQKLDLIPLYPPQQQPMNLLLAQLMPFRHSNNVNYSTHVQYSNQLTIDKWKSLSFCDMFKVINHQQKQQGLMIKLCLKDGQKQVNIVIQTPHFNPEVKHLYFQNISDLTAYLDHEISTASINDSGQLILRTTEKRVLSQINELLKHNYKKLERISRNLAFVKNQRSFQLGEHYEGLMIGYGQILTTSKVVYNPGQNFRAAHLSVGCRMTSTSQNAWANSFIYYLIDEDKSPEQIQFAVVQLNPESTVNRKRYMPIAYNYEESETFRKIDELGGQACFHYQLGDALVLLPNQIAFSPEAGFVVKADVPVSVRPGCPLLVVSSNNQCYAIGMLTDRQRGVTFRENLYWGLWKVDNLSHNSRNLKLSNSNLRVQHWKDISLSTFLCPYLNHFNISDTPFDKEEDYLLPGMKAPTQQWFTMAFYQKQIIIGDPTDSQQIEEFARVLQEQYGQNCEMVTNFYYEITISLTIKFQQSYFFDVERIIQICGRVLQREGNKPRSMILVCIVAMNMSRLYSSMCQRSDNLRNNIFLSRSEDILKHYEDYITKINDSDLNESLYRGLATVYANRNDRQFLIKYCDLIAQIQENNKNVQSFTFRQICVRNSLELHNQKRAVRQILKCYDGAVRMGSKSKETEIMAKLKVLCQNVNTEVIRSNRVDSQTIDLCIEAIEKVIPQNATDLVPIFIDKRRRVESSKYIGFA